MKKINKTLSLLEELKYPDVVCRLESRGEIDETFVNQLFFKTESRLSLLEWLIQRHDERLIPQNESDYYEQSLKEDRVNKIKKALQRIGIAFYSRSSRTNDLSRIVEGLLGKDTSVDLVYRLAKFVYITLQSNNCGSSSFQDSVIALTALAENKKALLNKSPNLFSIDFPAQGTTENFQGRALDTIIEKTLNKKLIELDELESNNLEKIDDCKEIFVSNKAKAWFKEAMEIFYCRFEGLPTYHDARAQNDEVTQELLSLKFSKNYSKNLQRFIDEHENSLRLASKLSSELPSYSEFGPGALNIL